MNKPPINFIHGLAKRGSNNYLYSAWEHIKGRCYNPRDKSYHAYGARGIALFCEWISDPAAFVDWVLSNLGERPAGHSIDRLNNDGDYAPGNLRWADATTQSRNTRRNRRMLAFGQELTLVEWAAKTGLGEMTIHCRIKRGWPVEDALSAKPGSQYRKVKRR